jgi:hypothetical protein
LLTWPHSERWMFAIVTQPADRAAEHRRSRVEMINR